MKKAARMEAAALNSLPGGDMTSQRPVPPAIDRRSFICPHCGAFAHQDWLELKAQPLPDQSPLPTVLAAPPMQPGPKNAIADIAKVMELLSPNELKLVKFNDYADFNVQNLHLSECSSCEKIAIWHCRSLIWPPTNGAPSPNADLPPDVMIDYQEAGRIFTLSPRGAAALLRLGLQKMLLHLGESGENINKDIGSLVKKGLDPRIQQALDVVRVIGNNAVHPGAIDLRDDAATVQQLFSLINIIADRMITHPKQVSALYGGLPLGALEGIEQRDRS